MKTEMSCYICHKRNGVSTCSREDCVRRVCDVCKKLPNGGGEKWVQCQEKFQYYCNVHLIIKCMYCSKETNGCTKCVTKSKNGSFSIVTSCCVCQTTFAKCGDCEKVLLEQEYVDDTYGDKMRDLERCYSCKKYFCGPCGHYQMTDRYMSHSSPFCNKCLFIL